MCTVSVVPVNGQWIITSNRDETVLRSALAPESYTLNDKTIWYPRDPKAGGTWFAVSASLATVVLLNGAEHKHQAGSAYRRSRGLIVLDLLSGVQSVLAEWDALDLDQIEPFTLVVFEQTQLHQLRWDGVHKSRMDLDANRAHIWSSATLYSPENRAAREASFFDYLAQKPEVIPADLLDFHQLNLFDRNKTGLLNKPSGALQTISITQLVVHTNTAQLLHIDLPTKNQTIHQINRQT